MAPDLPLVSVVIPVLDDSAPLGRLLETLPPDRRSELIVVNGGLSDTDLRDLSATRRDVCWMATPPGRGRQMNVGAHVARGHWIMFVHADSRLPDRWREELEQVRDDPSVVGGSFRLRLDALTRAARVIEAGVARRVRWLDLPYGDQALFARREIFENLGGFREWPLMEDVDFVRRLARAGRLHHSDLPIITSARRWEENGWVRQTLKNLALTTLFFAGVSPGALGPCYRRERPGEHMSPLSPGSQRRAAVAVMAKAPSDVTGKTRLLRAIADDHVGLKRALLLDTLDATARIRGVDLFVLFAPSGAGAELRSLMPEGAQLVPQRGEGLGERLHNGFADLFALGYIRVVIVGSDIPTLAPDDVEYALTELCEDEARVVLGPAGDGGYYLIGLSAVRAELFESIPWSTDETLAATLAAAHECGLRVSLMRRCDDVDAVDDLLRVLDAVPTHGSSGAHTRAWVACHPDVGGAQAGRRISR